MEIILKQDVINLGYKDDIVTVRNGYGANWLIPQGLAIMATPTAKKVHAESHVRAAEDGSLLRRFFQMLEKTIQQNPEYYLWSHNRWKRTHEEYNRRFGITE